MLRRLQIQNFVIVVSLDLEFHSGFGALTGETGAGKSILLDALGLILGNRAEASVVRHGEKQADIQAEFDLPDEETARHWFEEQMLPMEDSSVLIRRVVDAGGRSRSWINGVQVTLTQLRELGVWLADIHGQHAHYALLQTEAQRTLLDKHAGVAALVHEVQQLYREWMHCVTRREETEHHSEQRVRELELLQWQWKELRELDFDPVQWLETNADHQRLAHAAGLMQGTDEVLQLLGDDGAALSTLQRAGAQTDTLSQVDPALTEVGKLLQEAAIQADEAYHVLRRYRERVELDPQRLDEIENRIEDVSRICRKYRIEPDELPAFIDSTEEKLKQFETLSDPQQLLLQEQQAAAAYRKAAEKLSAARRPIAARLSAQVTAVMQTLAMKEGRFEVILQPLAQGTAYGLESVEFCVAANAGQALKPMSRVASGGELSRIGLAIQVITSQSAAVPTMIFDEVDAGIGGGVAETVGRLLRQLGRDKQVLCVTHLAQVSCCADWQWKIAKQQRDGQTTSSVALLSEEQRIEEIARMLGGVTLTDTTRAHAREMLLQAGK